MDYTKLSNCFAQVSYNGVFNIEILDSPPINSFRNQVASTLVMDSSLATFNFYKVVNTLSIYNVMDLDDNYKFEVSTDMSSMYLDYYFDDGDYFYITPLGDWVVFTLYRSCMRVSIPKLKVI